MPGLWLCVTCRGRTFGRSCLSHSAECQAYLWKVLPIALSRVPGLSAWPLALCHMEGQHLMAGAAYRIQQSARLSVRPLALYKHVTTVPNARYWNSRMHSIESAVITYTIIITCFSQVSPLTLARGQALTAGVTRGLTVRQQVRQSDTTEAHTMNIIISVPQVPTPSRSSYWHYRPAEL